MLRYTFKKFCDVYNLQFVILLLDVKMTWNSFYEMLVVAAKLIDAFVML